MYLLENPFSLTLILTGVTFLITGLIFLYNPPKNINGVYGYRTKLSQKSIEHWHFAQNHSAKSMLWTSVAMVIIGVIGIFVTLEIITGVILSLIIVLLLCGLMIYVTEKALNSLDHNK